MQAPRLVSFGLWTFTAFSLVTLALKYEPVAQQPLPAAPAPQQASFRAQDMAQLLMASAAGAVPQAQDQGSLRLKGIAYASAPGQSRALIQTTSRKVEAFAPGSRLPNGAQLLHIERRAIVYEQDGQHHRLSLPQRS